MLMHGQGWDTTTDKPSTCAHRTPLPLKGRITLLRVTREWIKIKKNKAQNPRLESPTIVVQHTAQHTGDGDSPLWRYWVGVEEDMSSSGNWVKWCIHSLLHGGQFIPHGPTMSVCTKVMTKGVHNIAFSVTPDMFWPTSLWEWLCPLPYTIWCPNLVIVLSWCTSNVVTNIRYVCTYYVSTTIARKTATAQKIYTLKTPSNVTATQHTKNKYEQEWHVQQKTP